MGGKKVRKLRSIYQIIYKVKIKLQKNHHVFAVHFNAMVRGFILFVYKKHTIGVPSNESPNVHTFAKIIPKHRLYLCL